MAFANNNKKCYPKLLIYILLISVTCTVCVLCTRDIISEIFLMPDAVNYCPIDSDENLNPLEQSLEDNSIGKDSYPNENDRNQNVLDTLKVILKKVKKGVKSDAKEASESDSPEDTHVKVRNSHHQNSEVLEHDLPEDRTGESDTSKLKEESEDRDSSHTQSSTTTKSNRKKIKNDDVSVVNNLKEEDQVTLIEESINIKNTQNIDETPVGESDELARKKRIQRKNADNGLENTPQRGTLIDVSYVPSHDDLSVVQNTSHEWQESSLTEESHDPDPVGDEKDAYDNSSVPVEVLAEEGNEAVNISYAAPRKESSETASDENPEIADEETAETVDKETPETADEKIQETADKEIQTDDEETPVVTTEKESEISAAEVDANASTVLPDEAILDETPKEKDQLETYSQFAERVLAEKKNGAAGSNGLTGNGQSGSKGPKVKSKNYASTDCGAKYIAANPEASHSHKIINSNKDEYMLNKCTEKIWVVVELCESIKPQKFDIANFELFSNLPKEIRLYGTHRYPTRDWVSLGVFIGEEGNRDVQSFNVETQEFFKFIKLEVHSHYGSEFYCPLSLFRMYGMSEFEIIEEETEEEQVMEEEEEESHDEKEGAPEVEKGKNGIMIPDVLKAIFNGVLEVIKRGSRSGNITDLPELNTYNQTCKSLKEDFAVKNESCNFADSLNYILACYYDEYLKLLMNPFLATVVQNAYFCQQLATIICTSPHNNDSYVYDSICNNSYACVMLSPKHILAMCYMNDPLLLNEFIDCDSEKSEGEQRSKNFSTKSNIDELPLNIPVDIQEGSVNTDEISQNDNRNSSTGTVPASEADLPNVELPYQPDADATMTPDDSKQKISEEDGDNAGLNSASRPESNSSSPVPENTDKTEKASDKKKERKPEKANAEKNKDSEDSLPQESKASQPTTTTTTPSPTTAIPATSSENRVASHSNKESVVVRLSNKIKVLEHNMSISSQYLEELSRRYKRQMEDMERQFNITILALNRTSQTAYERDLYHQKRLETLENQLEELTQLVTTVVKEKESLLMNVIEQHMILLFIEVLVMCLVFSFCLKRRRDDVNRVASSAAGAAPVRNDESKSESSICSIESDQQGRDTPSHYRRRSVDSIKMENEVKPKERRFSGQTAVIGSYKDLMLTDATTKEKKRKKKKTHLQRSFSNASIQDAKRRSSSVSSKKERKLEKLKKSSAGVLFSGEKGDDHLRKKDAVPKRDTADSAKQDDWHVVKRNKSKKNKNEMASRCPDDQGYAFSSDLKRGKIALVEEPMCDVYQDPYYSEVIYDTGYDMYEKTYIDTKYKDYVQCHYTQGIDPNTLCDPVSQVYDVPDFDCSVPVINDYYHNTTDLSYNPRIIEDQERNGHSETITSLWDPDGMTKSMLKTLRQPVVPPSLKGKTRLRSDNWEWYSSQPSRLNSKLSNSAEIISTSSSSDSSGRSKKIINPDIKINILKGDKKKKKKKGLRLTNGEGH